jgi:SAM-dependent methyltransferase
MSPRLADERLKETLRSYDAHPEFYAKRYRTVDMSAYRGAFLRALPDPHGRVLDGGCGPGRDCAEFAKAGVSVVGLDLSAGLLAEARSYAPAAEYVNGDLRSLPFREGSFDGVWLCSSLVHLPADLVATILEESYRVLRGGGVVFASVMEGTEAGWREDHMTGRRWFQPFTEESFTGLVEGAGFSVISVQAEPGVAMGRWINAFVKRAG